MWVYANAKASVQCICTGLCVRICTVHIMCECVCVCVCVCMCVCVCLCVLRAKTSGTPIITPGRAGFSADLYGMCACMAGGKQL
jgi:hypothetical protein